MNVIPVLHLLIFSADIFLIILVLGKNPMAQLNRYCAVLIGTIAIWSFCLALANLSNTAEDAMFFFNLSALGWGWLPFGILLFYLSLANKERILNNRLVLSAAVLLTVFFIFQQWTGNMMSTVIRTDCGWVAIWDKNIFSYSYLAAVCISILIAAYLIIELAAKASTGREKKIAFMLIVTGMVAVIGGLATALFFQFSGMKANLQVTDIFGMIWVAGITYAVSRYGLMSVSPVIAAEEILKTTRDSIILLDSNKKIVYANDAAYKLLGWHNDKEIWRKNLSFNSIVREKEKADSWLKDAVASGKDGQIELSYLAVNGMEIPVLVSTSDIKKERNGNLLGYVVSAIDISERKLAEEMLSISNERLKKILIDTIDAMGKIVELRDPYTSGHQRRVTKLATAIAREMDMEEEKLELLRLAALIHDIGKVYIPSDILSKPGKLSSPEYHILTTHARSGYDVIKHLDFPPAMAKAVLQHHERLDGSGYPDGLKDDDISIEARILAVADVIEAMASNRPYRAALGLDAALEEVEKHKGVRYDPAVVDICLRLFREKSFAFE